MSTLQEAAMTAERAAFFLRRFKSEEKMLGPNEQAAIDFAIAALTQQGEQQPVAVSDAMVEAYLTAQRKTVEEADRFGRPNAGGLHTNTVREACRNGITAALAAAPAPVAQQRMTDEQIEDLVKQCGGKWNGDVWTFEDADLHPFVRTALQSAQPVALANAEPTKVKP